MTFDPKEARALVDELQYKDRMSDCWCPNRRAAAHLTAALDEIERLKSALDLIATHRAKCHEHDDDMGHSRRDFDEEDVKLMEYVARAALKGSDQ